MPYSPRTWFDNPSGGTPIQAVYLNNIERGIKDAGWVYNVKDANYAAVGDGSHDDTLNIQSAIDACVAAGGGTVFFPVGQYKITSGLTCPSTSLVAFIGAGPTGYSTLLSPGVSRILVPVGVTGLTIGTSGVGVYTGSPVIRDLHFMGPGSTTNSATIGLNIINSSGFRVEDSCFSDFYTAGTGMLVNGISTHESSYGHVTGCFFVKNFIGLDCGDATNQTGVTVMASLFDAENNSLPTPIAGSIGINNAARVIGCELQSYETLINYTLQASDLSFVANRYENFVNAVYIRPTADQVYRGNVTGGTMSSAVTGALGVRLNSHASQVTVDIRAWVPHEDLNGGNSILDPNISLTHRLTGADRGFHIGYSAASDIGWFTYPGNPEGAVAATPGSMLGDTVNGVLWMKNTGTGNTGWKLVTQAP